MQINMTDVKKKYDMWRQEHGSLRGLPIELQAQAVVLLKNHAWSAVRDALHVSNSSLSRWRHSDAVKSMVERFIQKISSESTKVALKGETESAHSFVEIPAPLSGVLPEKHQSPIHIVLQTPNGFSLRIEGSMDGPFVQKIAQVICQSGTEVSA